jgi:hypothetical protein
MAPGNAAAELGEGRRCAGPRRRYPPAASLDSLATVQVRQPWLVFHLVFKLADRWIDGWMDGFRLALLCTLQAVCACLLSARASAATALLLQVPAWCRSSGGECGSRPGGLPLKELQVTHCLRYLASYCISATHKLRTDRMRRSCAYLPASSTWACCKHASSLTSRRPCAPGR